MLLKAFPSGPFATNAYVLISNGVAAIFDPAPDSFDAVRGAVEDKKVVGIFLTHSHWDHIGDLARCKEEWDVPVWVHRLDENNVTEPGSDGLPMIMPIESTSVDDYLGEGDTITVGGVSMEVIHTPGHTPGGVCFYLKSEKVLIAGDTLFKGSFGNLSFPTGNPDAMWTSLKKLAKLPGDTEVYPGHGEPTTIGDEDWMENAKEVYLC